MPFSPHYSSSHPSLIHTPLHSTQFNVSHSTASSRRWLWRRCWNWLLLRCRYVWYLIHSGMQANRWYKSHVANVAQNRYTRFSTKSSEEFNTASRSVKPGLIASGIVSAWTWAATLLQSSTVAYEYGVAGPFWVCRLDVNSSKRSSLVLVCRRCDGTDSHVLDIGLQSQAERSEMPYILGDNLYPLWRANTLGFHFLRASNERLG